MKYALAAVALPTLVTLFLLLFCLYSWIFLIPATLSFGDMVARFKDYRNATKTLSQENILRTFSKHKRSACQRYAVTAAALHKGIECKGVFRNMGYKFYHVFPDKTFTRKCPFLKLKFYKALLRPTSPAIN